MHDRRLQGVLNGNDGYFFLHTPGAVQRARHYFPGEQVDGDAQNSTLVIVAPGGDGRLARRAGGV